MTATLTILDLDTVSKSTAAGLAACFASIAGVPIGAATAAQDPSGQTTPVAAVPTSATPVATSEPSMPASAVDPSIALTAKYFPTNPGDAAFPSPENSAIRRNADGTFGGKPYLLDKSGSKHTLDAPGAAGPHGYSVNDRETQGGGSNDTYNLLIVRQGQVYAQLAGGQWQHFDPAMGGMYNAGSLPDAFTTDPTSGATTSTIAPSNVTVPATPAAMTPAPGTSGATVLVGAGGLATIDEGIQAAKPGDIVRILAGNYRETPKWWATPGLRIIFDSPDAILDLTGLTGTLARGKGALVPCADAFIENPYITGVALDQDTQSTAAIRPDSGCGFLTVKGGRLYKNQFGVAGGDVPCTVTIEDTVFDFNGLNNGSSHDIYLSNGILLVTLNNVTATNPNGGYPVKIRAFNAIINGGTFQSGDAACFDFPNGSVGQVLVKGATLTKPAGSNDHKVLRYAEESLISGNGGMLLTGCTINALCGSPLVDVGSASAVTFDPSCKITGKMVSQGGKVIGL